ncbi:MAG: sugar transporter [Clostridiaceae bacterium]|nr:sugar transporter [Clostridiaceae bacterium]
MDKLTTRNRFFYSVGTIGRDMQYTIVAMFLNVYLTEVLNLPDETLWWTTGITLAVRVYDAVNDPLMGLFVDNTKSRFGKFKPWIVIGGLLSALFTVLFFTDIGLRGTAYIISFTVIYLLWEVSFSGNDIGYWSMLPTLSIEQKTREKIGSTARICANIGLFITVVAILPVTSIIGNMTGEDLSKSVPNEEGYAVFFVDHTFPEEDAMRDSFSMVIIGEEAQYEGPIYIDNIRLMVSDTRGTSSVEDRTLAVWNFEDTGDTSFADRDIFGDVPALPTESAPGLDGNALKVDLRFLPGGTKEKTIGTTLSEPIDFSKGVSVKYELYLPSADLGDRSGKVQTVSVFESIADGNRVEQKSMMGGRKTGFFIVAVAIVIIAIVTQSFTVFGVKERREVFKQETKTSLRELARAIVKNDQLLFTLISLALFMIGYTTTTSFGTYFFIYAYRDEGMYSVFAAILGVSQLVALSVFPAFSKRFSRKQLYLFGTILVIIGYIVFFFAPMNMFFIGAAGIPLFVGQAFIQLLMLMFLADTIEYGQWKLGKRNESITFSVQPFINKIGGAVGNAIVGATVILSGISAANGDPDKVTESGLFMMKSAMLIIPLILIVIGFIVYKLYFKIDKEFYDKIITDLKERGDIAEEA